MSRPELSREGILERILDLSWRVSCHSPPMKPFIRFSKQSDYLYQQSSYRNRKHLFWDFDHSLQRVLLRLLKALATPEELFLLSVERWKQNLEQLVIDSREKLDSLIESGQKPESNYRVRDEFIFSQVEPGSRFLYLGCGSGTECLRYARRGYWVLGIDTVFELVNVAKDRARYLERSFIPICMDAFWLALRAKSFGGFLLEFYGSQPLLPQMLGLQEDLARVLRESGRGIIVAGRKAYASFWYLMGSYYPSQMTSWLRKQSRLDFYFSERDGFEERLVYGLYSRSHTRESLALELSYAFDVQECFYEDDPRYVIGVVRPKEHVDLAILSDEHFAHYDVRDTLLNAAQIDIPGVLDGVESVCRILESHEENVIECYHCADSFTGRSPALTVDTDVSRMISLLESVFVVLPVEVSR